jgi:hypothetical protein
MIKNMNNLVNCKFYVFQGNTVRGQSLEYPGVLIFLFILKLVSVFGN